MVVLIIVCDALQDPDTVLDRGLVDRDGLEAAFERAVLFDVLAVFGKGRRADDLDLAAAESRLQNVGGVHAALGIARADNVMHLVDDEDDVAVAADLFDQALHAAFKLAAELRPGHERRQVKQKYLLSLQLIRHFSVRDPLGQALGDGRLADARLADQAGIVFLTAVEDLDHTLQFLGPADHGVQLALGGACRQVNTVVIQKLMLAARGVFPIALRRTGRAAVLAVLLGAAEKAVEEREGRGLAVIVLAAVVVGGKKLLRPGEGVHHISGEAVKVLVGDPHLFDNIVHGLDMQLPGAFEAQPLVFCLSVFDFGDENHRDVFAAAGAHRRLHRFPPWDKAEITSNRW